MSNIKNNLDNILENIKNTTKSEDYFQKLIAVSKTKPVPDLQEAYDDNA